MSAAAENRKTMKQPVPVTSGRGAALYITLGMFMLTLGIAFLIAIVSHQESFALQQLYYMLLGLCGPLCPGLPVLLVWGGAKLLVASRHRVSARNYMILFFLYALVLTGYTLTHRINQGAGFSIPYLDYIAQVNRAIAYAGSEFSASLNQAYQLRSSSAGGLIGMLLAWPLSHLLTRLGACILVGALMIVLVIVLFHFNPGAFFSKLSEYGQQRRENRQKQRQDTQPAGPAPVAPAQDEPMMPPSYYQPAPIYNTQPIVRRDEQGFIPVQPDLYEEDFPAEENRTPMEEPAWRKEPEPVAAPVSREDKAPADKSHVFGGFFNRFRTPAAPAEAPAAQEQPVQPALKPVKQAAQAPAVRPAAAVPPPAAQALDDMVEEEDELPWDVPQEAPVTPPPPAPLSKPAPVKARQETAKPAAAPKTEKPKAKPAEKAAPEPAKPSQPNSWAAQVERKKAEMELPVHTTVQSEPRQVFTEAVMPITGERIPITPRKEKTPSASERLDGTTAPKLRQMSMNELLPYEAKHIPLADTSQEDERRAQIIEGTLRSFGVESEVKQIMHGPAITRFAIQIAPGVKVSRVSNTSDNLALELKTKHVRVEAPIQGTNFIGIEVPNQLVSTVSLREVLESPEMKANPSPLLAALGKDIAGAPVLCDLSKMPHLLIAGATGSGKSVCINSIICSLLYRTSPQQVRLIMIDPKQVELNVYNPIPHLLVPVVSDPKKAAGALAWAVQEMTERYSKFSSQKVREIGGYNRIFEGTDKKLPYIVVIIDEMADLMETCRKDVEESIRRLAALARAAGIYMVLATQRPSVDVITGVIKNNIPSRIAFAVSSGTDSRTIIDINGAEKLMGKGDMLYKPAGVSPVRVQGCFVSDDEVNAIAEHIASRYQTDYDPNIVEHLESSANTPEADEITVGMDDGAAHNGNGEGSFQELLQQAIQMAVEDGQTSTSMLQRRLRVGYARAGRLIDEMEKRGIISQSEGSKPRKTIITMEQYQEMMKDD